jgi:hypothetical protein
VSSISVSFQMMRAGMSRGPSAQSCAGTGSTWLNVVTPELGRELADVAKAAMRFLTRPGTMLDIAQTRVANAPIEPGSRAVVRAVLNLYQLISTLRRSTNWSRITGASRSVKAVAGSSIMSA